MIRASHIVSVVVNGLWRGAFYRRMGRKILAEASEKRREMSSRRFRPLLSSECNHRTCHQQYGNFPGPTWPKIVDTRVVSPFDAGRDVRRSAGGGDSAMAGK